MLPAPSVVMVGSPRLIAIRAESSGRCLRPLQPTNLGAISISGNPTVRMAGGYEFAAHTRACSVGGGGYAS
jgi:hypothetical protein